MDLPVLFKKHIQDLFPADAEYLSDGNTKIRVSFSFLNRPDGRVWLLPEYWSTL